MTVAQRRERRRVARENVRGVCTAPLVVELALALALAAAGAAAQAEKPLVVVEIARPGEAAQLATSAPFRAFAGQGPKDLGAYLKLLSAPIEALSDRAAEYARHVRHVDRLRATLDGGGDFQLLLELDSAERAGLTKDLLLVEGTKRSSRQLADSPIVVEQRSGPRGALLTAQRGRLLALRAVRAADAQRDDPALRSLLARRPRAKLPFARTELSLGLVAHPFGAAAVAALEDIVLESELVRGDAGLEERIRVPASARMGDALVASHAIRDVASLLPAKTLAVVAVELRGFDALASLARAVARVLGAEELTTAALRPLTPTETSEPCAIAVFALPPSQGSALPELGLALRVPATPEPRALLAVLASQLKRVWKSRTDVATRTLGRGRERIAYLRLADFGGSDDERMDRKLAFGGGFLSAARAGDWLVLGCNPRSVRKLMRVGGTTLNARSDFARAFPAGRATLGGCFIDVRPLAAPGSAFSSLIAPLTLTIAPMVAVGLGLPPPDTARLRMERDYGAGRVRRFLSGLAPARFEIVPEKGSLLVERRGGTLLSPAAWAALVSAVALEHARGRLRD